MSDTVAIIFDAEFGNALRALPDRSIWVVRSPTNDAVVEQLRMEGLADLTTFTGDGQSASAAFDEALRMVELHHGEYSQNPPLQCVTVHGLRFEEGFRRSLNDLGFVLKEQHPTGFSACRANKQTG